ncbi:hypothetical protein WD019_02245 [Fictibacillus sp. Mic-4]|uniref:hypothetical protein n=1 Tax=Fictibacillus sp. Mic-4 TaxID=3132826 RepID=UPI003CF9D198
MSILFTVIFIFVCATNYDFLVRMASKVEIVEGFSLTPFGLWLVVFMFLALLDLANAVSDN